MLTRLRHWAEALILEVHAVWLAARDRRTPWGARLLGIGIAGYALSPIDLIPDFVPVLGLLDDLLIVPAGLWLFVRLVPDAVMADARIAAARAERDPRSRFVPVLIVLVWLVIAGALMWQFAGFSTW